MPTACSPFDFTAAVSRLCLDIVGRLDEFRHVDMDRVAVTFAQARRKTAWGLQAKLTPMRFEGGSLVSHRDGRAWRVQRLFHGEREILYILTFYLPRFLNQTFREKLVTVLHELYHISPQFDGDLRRFGGRYHMHSHSQKEYDRNMERLLDRYLELDPPDSLFAFLKKRFRSLKQAHGEIVGVRITMPKLIPVPGSKSA